ncbi:MAG: hypothetical protein AAGA17_21565, partial [Actinomycetota bacterium]
MAARSAWAAVPTVVWRLSAVLLVLAAAASACGDADDGESTSSTESGVDAAPVADDGDTDVSRPDTTLPVDADDTGGGGDGIAMKSFTDDMGRTVDVPVEPQRIVAINEFSHAEPLLALGAPLIGMTDQGGG